MQLDLREQEIYDELMFEPYGLLYESQEGVPSKSPHALPGFDVDITPSQKPAVPVAPPKSHEAPIRIPHVAEQLIDVPDPKEDHVLPDDFYLRELSVYTNNVLQFPASGNLRAQPTELRVYGVRYEPKIRALDAPTETPVPNVEGKWKEQTIRSIPKQMLEYSNIYCKAARTLQPWPGGLLDQSTLVTDMSQGMWTAAIENDLVHELKPCYGTTNMVSTPSVKDILEAISDATTGKKKLPKTNHLMFLHTNKAVVLLARHIRCDRYGRWAFYMYKFADYLLCAPFDIFSTDVWTTIVRSVPETGPDRPLIRKIGAHANKVLETLSDTFVPVSAATMTKSVRASHKEMVHERILLFAQLLLSLDLLCKVLKDSDGTVDAVNISKIVYMVLQRDVVAPLRASGWALAVFKNICAGCVVVRGGGRARFEIPEGSLLTVPIMRYMLLTLAVYLRSKTEWIMPRTLGKLDAQYTSKLCVWVTMIQRDFLLRIASMYLVHSIPPGQPVEAVPTLRTTAANRAECTYRAVYVDNHISGACTVVDDEIRAIPDKDLRALLALLSGIRMSHVATAENAICLGAMVHVCMAVSERLYDGEKVAGVQQIKEITDLLPQWFVVFVQDECKLLEVGGDILSPGKLLAPSRAFDVLCRAARTQLATVALDNTYSFIPPVTEDEAYQPNEWNDVWPENVAKQAPLSDSPKSAKNKPSPAAKGAGRAAPRPAAKEARKAAPRRAPKGTTRAASSSPDVPDVTPMQAPEARSMSRSPSPSPSLSLRNPAARNEAGAAAAATAAAEGSAGSVGDVFTHEPAVTRMEDVARPTPIHLAILRIGAR